MNITIAGKDYLAEDWTLRESLRGPWRASLLLATEDTLASGQRVLVGSAAWQGTVTSVAVTGGKTRLEIIAGANGLRLATTARQYDTIAYQSILNDICGDVSETAGTIDGSIGAWRTRGAQLETELRRLSPDWYIAADGSVMLARAPVTKDLPGELIRASGDALLYACDEPLPLVDDTHDTAIFCRGTGRPYVALFPRREPLRAEPAIEIGTVDKLTGGRASIQLDSGESLSDIPLFCAAGFVPEGALGVRVLVLDIGGDASHTIAITGVDGQIDSLTLARAQDAGPLLRAGDLVNLTGLISGAPGAPVTCTPMGTRIDYDPILKNLPPGAPGVGPSRVEG